MNVIETIKGQMAESARVKQRMLEDDALVEKIEDIAGLIVDAYRSGNKTMWAGNGGSAADAQHMAGELVNKFTFDRPGLPALSLSTDTSIMKRLRFRAAFCTSNRGTGPARRRFYRHLHLRQVTEPRGGPCCLQSEGYQERCDRGFRGLPDGRL